MRLLILLLLSGLANPPAVDSVRTRQYAPRPASEAIAWQEALRADFARLLNIHDLLAEEKQVAPDPKELKSEDKGAFTLKEIEISSTPGRRIRVILTIPHYASPSRDSPSPRFRAVVCIHGHRGKPDSVYDPNSLYKGFASELASQGFVTIAPVVSQHVVYEEGRTLMGERLWDVMRCVDYLETLPQADPQRIGCGGLSLGGEMAMWLGAMDTRIKATVSSGFLTRMDQMEQGHCMCWKFPGLRELVDFADVYSLIAPRALQCQNGLEERATGFTVALAEEAMKEIRLIYADLDHPERAMLIAHPEGHVVDVHALVSFFKEEL